MWANVNCWVKKCLNSCISERRSRFFSEQLCKCVKLWMTGCANKRICEWLSEQVNVWKYELWVNGWVGEWLNVCILDWASEWVSAWVNEWMSECVSERVSEPVSEWACEWAYGSAGNFIIVKPSLGAMLITLHKSVFVRLYIKLNAFLLISHQQLSFNMPSRDIAQL